MLIIQSHDSQLESLITCPGVIYCIKDNGSDFRLWFIHVASMNEIMTSLGLFL